MTYRVTVLKDVKYEKRYNYKIIKFVKINKIKNYDCINIQS